MDDNNVCPTCHQRLAYRSSVSRGIVHTLKQIATLVESKGVNAVHIEKEMVQKGLLTGNQGRNYTHMVRHGLIAHVAGEPGNYALTRKAMGFLAGDPIPKTVVVSKRSEEGGSHTTGYGDEVCVISDFNGKGEYWTVPGFDIREGRVIREPATLL